MPFASWQTSLQNSFPSAGTQLQAGWAHFNVAFIESPFDRLRGWLKPHGVIARDIEQTREDDADECRSQRIVRYGFCAAAAVTCTGFSASGVDELTAAAGFSTGISVPAG